MEAAGKRYILYGSRADTITIWNFADLHIGNKGVALDRLKDDIETVRNDPYSFWFGGGDYADYISPGDKRFDPTCMPDNISVRDLGSLGIVLARQVRDLVNPIKHKCLGLLIGNHELTYQRSKEQLALHDWLCLELGVPNFGYSCIFDVVFSRVTNLAIPKIVNDNQSAKGAFFTIRCFAHHGAGAAQTPGGKLNKLAQFMDSFDADVYWIAHVHDQAGKRIIVLAADQDCNHIVERDKLGIITGSYLRTYAQGVTGYGEIKGYKPVPLGARYVKVTPSKKRLEGTI